METVKQFFGVLLLATAIWLISPVVPGALSLFMWAALFIVYSLYLGALDFVSQGKSAFKRVIQGFAFLTLIWGVAMLIGSSMGAQSPLQPLQGLANRMDKSILSTSNEKLPFVTIGSIQELNDILSGSKKPVMLDFYAEWCVACKEMELLTFSRPAVREAMSSYLVVKADVTSNTDANKALLKKYGLFGPPAIVFMQPDGTEITKLRTIGFKGEKDFLAVLNH